MPKGAFMMRLFGRFIGLDTTFQSIQTILYCCLEDHQKLEAGAFYSQHYASKYRDGQTGGWPIEHSPRSAPPSPRMRSCSITVQ